MPEEARDVSHTGRAPEQGLRVHRRGGRRLLLRPGGEIFGILGPNGAGKTTTVECMEGLRAQDSGSVRILGLDPHADRDELTQVLGVQLQESALPDKLFVGEALDLYSSFYRDPSTGGRW